MNSQPQSSAIGSLQHSSGELSSPFIRNAQTSSPKQPGLTKESLSSVVLKADDLKEAYVVVAGFMELLSYNCKATLANNKDCAQVPYLDMLFAP